MRRSPICNSLFSILLFIAGSGFTIELPASANLSAINNDVPGITGCCLDGADSLQVRATGTGRTTGNIATLSVTNNGKEAVNIAPQLLYIPSDGKYQSYVGWTPEGITIDPGQTGDMPVNGVCTDVHTPPVPEGEKMPPISEWVPVNFMETPDPRNPYSPGSIPVIPDEPLPSFTPAVIPEILKNPGYKPMPGETGKPGITYPGTDIPVGGSFNPNSDPRIFAPVVVRVVEQIKDAVKTIQNDPNITTPFSPDPQREREALLQQTVWIYMGILTGDRYEKEDFAKNVYKQFENRSGMAVTAIPKEDKEKLDTGVDNFWSAFMATGVEAKVIRNDDVVQAQIFPGLDKDELRKKLEKEEGQEKGQGDEPGGTPRTPDDENENPGAAQEAQADCKCDSMTFTVATDFGGLPANASRQKVEKFTANKSSTHKVVIELDEEDFRHKTTLNVSAVTVYCSNCGDTPCVYYKGNTSKRDSGDGNKVEISDVSVKGAEVAKDSQTISDNGLSVDVTPDKKAANYFLTCKVSATCMAEDCGKDICIRYISVEVKSKKSKK